MGGFVRVLRAAGNVEGAEQKRFIDTLDLELDLDAREAVRHAE